MSDLNPRIVAKLQRIPKVAQEAAAAQIEIEAEKLVRLMKHYAPIRYGDLVESIGWTSGEAPAGTFKISEYKDEQYADLRVTIYAGGKTPSGGDAFYARWVEFGTAPHAIADAGEGKMHPGARPQPFFYLAYAELKAEMRHNIRQAVRDAIRSM